ncbi:MAG: hypothetical protein GY703_11395, partial [Gammaproteobacteria bacterium]|nr:hypothetical protein [Gammaproteobacteria bacterium]
MSATRWKGFKPLNRILLLFLLSVSSLYAEVFVRDDIIRDPDPRSFSVCYNHTCKDLETVGLNTEQWQGIRMSFNPPAEDAGKERRQIAVAIARMERLVGQLVNTEQDRGGNMAGLLSGKRQMDCID